MYDRFESLQFPQDSIKILNAAREKRELAGDGEAR